jgi:hypothetical protein
MIKAQEKHQALTHKNSYKDRRIQKIIKKSNDPQK